MEVFDIQTAVIGAGVVGLAVARELSERGEEVLVLEKEHSFGIHTSSRNSEVIHAGLYYPTGSLKAGLCVEGRERLYRYCQERYIPYNKCGKLIVATDEEQLRRLEYIKAQAELNGCGGLSLLNKRQVKEIEPELLSVGALLSPQTGIIDSHALMVQLIADLEANSGMVVFNSEVSLLRCDEAVKEILVNGGQFKLRAKKLINCCGLDAVAFEHGVQSIGAKAKRYFYAKGNYFSYAAAVPFKHLIYPVPVEGGLGTHLTLDLQGRAKFGPDVEWLDKTRIGDSDYLVDDQKRDSFYQAIRSYWPDVIKDKLIPDYAGVRPKLSAEGQAVADFSIRGESLHGIPGYVALQGIESPGLTSSLAIAKYVSGLV